MGPNSCIKTRIHTRSVSISLWICGIFTGVMVLMVLIPSYTRAEQSKPGEYEVKAAFLYNFVKFVEWPDAKKTRAGRIINICILGQDPFGDALDFIQNETVQGLRLVVKRVARQHTGDCQVLFISNSEREDIRHILGLVKALNVLTVGDTEGFAQKGVIINFYIEEGKVRFEINLNALKRSELSISSKVMHLARIIQDE